MLAEEERTLPTTTYHLVPSPSLIMSSELRMPAYAVVEDDEFHWGGTFDRATYLWFMPSSPIHVPRSMLEREAAFLDKERTATQTQCRTCKKLYLRGSPLSSDHDECAACYFLGIVNRWLPPASGTPFQVVPCTEGCPEPGRQWFVGQLRYYDPALGIMQCPLDGHLFSRAEAEGAKPGLCLDDTSMRSMVYRDYYCDTRWNDRAARQWIYCSPCPALRRLFNLE